jgi:uncharacterized membrane protein (DUF441 family)
MKALSSVYELVVAGKEKAVAAFIVGAVAAFVAKHGLTLDVTTQAALQSLVVGLVLHVAVYFTRNKS